MIYAPHLHEEISPWSGRLKTYNGAEEWALFKTDAVVRLLDFHELLLVFLQVEGTEGAAAMVLRLEALPESLVSIWSAPHLGIFRSSFGKEQ